jgi:hypothetical protein
MLFSNDAMNTGERTIIRAEDSMQADYEQDMAEHLTAAAIAHEEWLARHNLVEDDTIPQGHMFAYEPTRFERFAFLAGRQNGKVSVITRIANACEALADGDYIVPAWQGAKLSGRVRVIEDRRAVDRSFENEVQLHG